MLNGLGELQYSTIDVKLLEFRDPSVTDYE